MEETKRIPCVFMRGGTSKALFFKADDLPTNEDEQNKMLLRAMGSPDQRQIDGMGGASTSTSKVAIISKSKRSGIDVDYDFGQVDVVAPIVGKTMNCGNISSAVGPYAIDEGMVKVTEPITEVHIYNVNTQKEIVAAVPVKNGKFYSKGDYSIDGVPGTGSKITLKFVDPQGSASGRLLPTGNAKDYIDIEGKIYEYSFVDSANPVVFVHPEDFGCTGRELPAEFNAMKSCKEVCRLLEIIRGTCAIKLGYASDLDDARVNSQTLPKIAFVSAPAEYISGNGKPVREDEMDIVGRLFSVNMKMIDAYMGTGAICTITAANTAGTIVNDIIASKNSLRKVTSLRIGHPWGIMTSMAELPEDGSDGVSCAYLNRTARRIMDGYVYV